MSRKVKITVFVTCLILLVACSRYVNFNTQNFAYLYNPALTTLHPEAFIYHQCDTSSIIFFRINTNELSYNFQTKDNFNRAKLDVHYRILDPTNFSSIVDSSTSTYFFQRANKGEKFMTYIPFRTNRVGKYYLQVYFIDAVKRQAYEYFSVFDKTDKNTKENYFLISSKNQQPCFTNRFDSTETVTIKCDRYAPSRLKIYYYSREYDLPLPPHSMGKDKEIIPSADTSWYVNYKDSANIVLKKKGCYFVQSDTTKKTGLALFNFGSNFPQMKNAKEMLLPLKYLSTKTKYQEMLMQANAKLALDEFWMRTCNDATRAKELIRVFYSRIQLANLHFSSYKEGWKTDRGMVFVVLGPPSDIVLSENQEQWIYRLKPGNSTLVFNFNKFSHPFCDNNYLMTRTDMYKNAWFQAVDTWQNGRAFTVE